MDAIYTLIKKNRSADEAAFKKAERDQIRALIRQKYDPEDELAILRQKDTKPEEFEEYNTYAEWCKRTVKDRLLDTQEA